MYQLNLIQTIVVFVLPVLFAITVHETAHGWVAKKLGDPTAQMMGRLTLNPIKHIDPIGTILVPVILLIMSNFIFGWAKPVPVTWENLRNPKRDMALVALAGPMSNFLMCIIWSILAKIILLLSSAAFDAMIVPLMYMCVVGMFMNLVLMFLNLLPIPPLDGGRIMTGILPDKLSWKYSRIEPYGLFILIGMMVFGFLQMIIWTPVLLSIGIICAILGLPTQQITNMFFSLFA